MKNIAEFLEKLKGVDIDPDVLELAALIVRTQEGANRYGQPIGSVVQRDQRQTKGRKAKKDVQGGGKSGKLPSSAEEQQSSPSGSSASSSSSTSTPSPTEAAANSANGPQATLVKLLIEKGADPVVAQKAVDQLEGNSPQQIQLFIARLKEQAQGELPGQVNWATPNNQTSPPGSNPIPDPKTKEAPSKPIPSPGKEDQKEDPDAKTEIYHWKGQDIRVPKDARVGTLPAQVPGTPAFLFWYDPNTGEVSGVDDSGNSVPSRKLPAGSSVKAFFKNLQEVGGVKSGLYVKSERSSIHMIVHADGTGREVKANGDSKELTGAQVRRKFINGINKEVDSPPKSKKKKVTLSQEEEATSEEVIIPESAGTVVPASEIESDLVEVTLEELPTDEEIVEQLMEEVEEELDKEEPVLEEISTESIELEQEFADIDNSAETESVSDPQEEPSDE